MAHSWHEESHFIHRSNWLRASVLGANDGLISTASLLMGLAAANVGTSTLLLTGLSALVAGAISMSAGEFVSVSSQADTEKADLERERQLLLDHPEEELEELTAIYQHRGLEPTLAKQVAIALTEHDALDTHARDEMGLTESSEAIPLQASIASGLSFSVGAIMPVLVSVLTPHGYLLGALAVSTLLGLALLGVISARLGGARVIPAVIRILLWGMLALLVTYGIGQMFEVSV